MTVASPISIERPEATFPSAHRRAGAAIEPFGEQVEFRRDGALPSRRSRRRVLRDSRGQVEVFGVDRYGTEQVYVVHEARSFTGELNLFSNSRSLVTSRAVTPLRVLRVERQELKRLITAEPELGKLLLRAFVLRRRTSFASVAQASR